MIRIISFTILSLLIRLDTFGQKDSNPMDSLNNIIYSQEYANLKYRYIDFQLDSVNLRIQYNSKHIMVDNFFTESQRSLNINYYFKNDSLFFVTTSQICPSRTQISLFSRYHIIAKKIGEADHVSIKRVNMGVSTPIKELQESQACSDQFDYNFLKEYILSLFERLVEKHPWRS